jgi:hypothetical protein
MDHDEKGDLSNSAELIILEKGQQKLLKAILKATMTSEIGREAVKERPVLLIAQGVLPQHLFVPFPFGNVNDKTSQTGWLSFTVYGV